MSATSVAFDGAIQDAADLDLDHAGPQLPISAQRPLGPMLGNSPVMHAAYHLIARVAPTTASVLLVGPTGSGKELAAQAIHDRSPRRQRPMFAINCGAVPANLIESELFGHVRGAFTGAERSRTGIFERAHGSTLLLDEITEMPLDLQVRLLRVLETRMITRVGGEKSMAVDLRIVAATNREPAEAVREGRLREDLLYRLSGVRISMPPLCERGDDVELLARHFLTRHAEEAGVTKTFSPHAIDAIRRYTWPGNVRELRNAVERGFILANDCIDSTHMGLTSEIIDAPSASNAGRVDPDSLCIPIGTPVREMEKQMIIATLKRLGNDKPRTALKLGISLKTLYIRLHQYRADGMLEACAG